MSGHELDPLHYSSTSGSLAGTVRGVKFKNGQSLHSGGCDQTDGIFNATPGSNEATVSTPSCFSSV